MAAYQYVYHMSGVSKTYPGGKKCFENIHLNFLPGVKIGVVGVNGAGKSTLMRIMAGIDKDFTGEAWAAQGARVGYLPQEPELDKRGRKKKAKPKLDFTTHAYRDDIALSGPVVKEKVPRVM